jgi:hypothetical protein
LSTPPTSIIFSNSLIPNATIIFKTWHSEHVQPDILNIEIKSKAARSRLFSLAQETPPPEHRSDSAAKPLKTKNYAGSHGGRGAAKG